MSSLSYPIVSKKHWFHFYFAFSIGVLFFIGLAAALVIIFFKLVHQNGFKASLIFMHLIAAGCVAISIYSFRRYMRNTPRISMDTDTIAFNDEVYYWNDLRQATLTGKSNFPYLFTYMMESTNLVFNDGSARIIFDDMYSNTWQLKSTITDMVPADKIIAISMRTTSVGHSFATDEVQTFKGNFLLSLRGLSFIAFTVLTYLIITSPKANSASIFGALALSGYVLLIAYQLNYFVVGSGELTIRNFILFAKRHVYPLEDIREIVYETRPKLPNYLRVILRDYQTRLYAAGTLRDKDWREMKRKFESAGITVRDECIGD